MRGVPGGRGTGAAVAGNALLGPMADRVEGQAAIAAGDGRLGARLLRQASAGFHRFDAEFELSRTDSLL